MLQAIHRAIFGDSYSLPASRVSRETAHGDYDGRLDVGDKGIFHDDAIFERQPDAEPPSSARPERLAQSTAPSATSRPDQQSRIILDIGSADSYCHFKIVGESHYQDRLRSVSSSGRSFTAVLMPEPTNASDRNAIRVVAEGADTIGYFSREDAASYAPVFKMLARHDCAGTCRARLTGGTDDRRSFGVLLNLRDASDLLISLRNALEPGSPVEANAEAF